MKLNSNKIIFTLGTVGLIALWRLQFTGNLTSTQYQTWSKTPKTITILDTTLDPKPHYLVKTQEGWHLNWTPYHSKTIFTPGDTMTIKGILEPFPIATNPGEFDANFNALTTGTKAKLTLAVILNHTQASLLNPRKIAWEIHQKIIQNNRKLLPPPYADLLVGFVFGNKNTDTAEDWKTNFQTLGLTHLLVVSGAQVALLSMSTLALLRIFRLPKWGEWSLLTITYGLFYLVTGGGPSIARAIWMGELAFGVKCFRRNTPPLILMTLAAVPLILLNPWCIFNIGFQLSFAATFALIWAKPLLEKIITSNPPNWALASLTTTSAASIFTAPILWYHFQTFSTGSLIANVAVTGLAELLVTTGYFSTLASLIWLPLAVIPHQACWALLKAIEFITTTLVPVFPNLILNAPPAWVIAILYLGLVSSLIAAKNHHQKEALTIITTTIVIIGLVLIQWPTNILKVTALDVGQGDALVIQTPNHKTFLIDTGNCIHRDNGKEVIIPYLHHEGIHHLEALILTHSDMDHIGGSFYLVDNIPISQLYHNGYLPTQVPKLTHKIITHHIPLHYLHQGKVIDQEPNLKIQCLYPDSSTRADDQTNNQCIILKLTYGHHSFLFTGDLEAEKERHLLPQDLHCTVLKIGHHGSKTSSSEPFLTATHPQYALISVGRHNTFGHPNPGVLQRLHHYHIQIIRTDQSGAITFLSNGKTLWIKIFNF